MNDQSKSPPPNPKSYSYYFGYSFFLTYFFGYYFFFSSAAGFEEPLFPAGADPEAPIFDAPLAINLLISFPFNDSMSLLRSSSDTLAPVDPKTFLTSAASMNIIIIY